MKPLTVTTCLGLDLEVGGLLIAILDVCFCIFLLFHGLAVFTLPENIAIASECFALFSWSRCKHLYFSSVLGIVLGFSWIYGMHKVSEIIDPCIGNNQQVEKTNEKLTRVCFWHWWIFHLKIYVYFRWRLILC